eukprot:gene8949-9871_t
MASVEWLSSTESSSVKYLNLPDVDAHSEQDGLMASRRRRLSSQNFNRIVGFAVTFAAISAIVIVVVLHYNPIHPPHHHSDDSTCYEAPSCTNILQTYDPVSGWTNLTGWPSDDITSQTTCCDICPATTSSMPDTSLKLGQSVDYSYLLMDQIWLPQFCNAFAKGHDPSLSHLAGSLCSDSVLSSTPRLVIHGLWPNVYDGTSICCKQSDGTSYSPLIPSLVQQWPVYKELTSIWFDPSTDSVCDGLTCGTCYLLNHEWQKHGTCFASFYPLAEDAIDLEVAYFSAGVALNTILSANSSSLAQWAGSVVTTSEVASIYNKQVNVMCDPQVSYSGAKNKRPENIRKTREEEKSTSDTIGVFLEIQTCWNITLPSSMKEKRESQSVSWNSAQSSLNAKFEMIDCPTPTSNSFTTPCPASLYIPLFNDI